MVDVKEIRLRSPHWQASDTVSTLSLLIPLKREKKVVESKGMEEKEGNRKKKESTWKVSDADECYSFSVL